MKGQRSPVWVLIGVAICAAISGMARGTAAPQDPAARDSVAQTGIEFVRIAAGTFQMGCSVGDNACRNDEKPAHSVRISKEFELGKYEVTQAQWQAVMGSNPSHFKGAARPVEFVSWDDAQEFIKKLNAKNDGYRYRLPTEAEWEYAARAGMAHEGLLETAWYRATRSIRQTYPVGRNKPNAWGLYDMLGNVAEIVDDWYGEQYYSGGAMTDPKGPSTGSFRVLRGSSWNGQAPSVRVSYRGPASPANRDSDSGLRLLRERSF